MRGARILARGRNLANDRMSETVTVGSFTDGTDPVTGDPIVVPVDTRYTGIGRIKYESLAVSETDGAGSPVATQAPILSVPTGSPAFFEGDGVTVTASVADGSLVGRSFTIAGRPQAGQTTSLRYPLEEMS